MKKWQLLSIRGFLVLLVIGLIGFQEVRISNLQAVTDLAYDGPSCCLPGSNIKDVRSCLESRNYEVRNFDKGVDVAAPRLTASGLMFRHFGFLIEYDPQGKVKDGRLSSAIAAF